MSNSKKEEKQKLSNTVQIIIAVTAVLTLIFGSGVFWKIVSMEDKHEGEELRTINSAESEDDEEIQIVDEKEQDIDSEAGTTTSIDVSKSNNEEMAVKETDVNVNKYVEMVSYEDARIESCPYMLCPEASSDGRIMIEWECMDNYQYYQLWVYEVEGEKFDLFKYVEVTGFSYELSVDDFDTDKQYSVNVSADNKHFSNPACFLVSWKKEYD